MWRIFKVLGKFERFESLHNPLSDVRFAEESQVIRRHRRGVEPPDRPEYKAHWTIIIWRGTKVGDSVSRPVLSSWKKYGHQTYEEIRTSRQPLFTATSSSVFSHWRLDFCSLVSPFLNVRENRLVLSNKDRGTIVATKNGAQVHSVRLLADFSFFEVFTAEGSVVLSFRAINKFARINI